MNRNDEYADLALPLGILHLAEQVGVGGGSEEVIRWRGSVGHAPLLMEVALVGVDVEFVDAMARVHVVTEAPL